MPKFPSSWSKVGVGGKLRLHPDDKQSSWPDVIFQEDPETFVPDRSTFPDEIVHQWGIVDEPPEDPSSDDMGFSVIQKLIQRQSITTMYHPYDTPLLQFISILERRKVKKSGSKEVVGDLMKKSFIIKMSLGYGCEEYVWRRFRVPASIKLSALHDQVIVPIMGWSRGYHGYVFEDVTDGSTIGPKRNAGYIDMMHAPMHYHYVMDDNDIPLATLLRKVGDWCNYTYDLGDSWDHKLKVEEVAERDDDANPVELFDGKGGCPPEDGNGLEEKGGPRYHKFLKAYVENPKRHKSVLAEASSSAVNYCRPWYGPKIKFHPLVFNVERHRLMLDMMLAGPLVRKKGNLGDGTFKETMKGCKVCGDRLSVLKIVPVVKARNIAQLNASVIIGKMDTRKLAYRSSST
eukprot:CAMPEP_0116004010 /NCGR_PEP_ID=MMETSP0321-20121206/361_1 /TAXON_ID=163516 /ORGANISM="Leptocylindrus danicus var. danicus, Strain B650" /LENGTH=401 /DNA_ID=CAMNT_0003472257 /DNA_START=20 /DNA_END=1226 /DNA_ORIENTATION=-